ncbi:hypothetical protein TNCV_2004061 [Trichonephila clavipes]|nr:hypothetical protein TNCV_2004061 [Trichonephila clavipes]
MTEGDVSTRRSTPAPHGLQLLPGSWQHDGLLLQEDYKAPSKRGYVVKKLSKNTKSLVSPPDGSAEYHFQKVKKRRNGKNQSGDFPVNLIRYPIV